MKLFKLYCVEDPGWDCNHGFVIRAQDELQARNIAQQQISDEYMESKDFWLNSNFSTCEVITTKGKAEIILNDFHAG